MLPMRDGVGASQVSLPVGPWRCLIDFLAERFPGIDAGEWARRMQRGEVVDATGRAVSAQQPYAPHGKLYYYRSVPHETPNPAQAEVIFEDELLVVADKPHFLPVTPSGPYLQETLLIRLRRQLGIADLAPLHRIDRDTAGVVLFAKQPASRGAYQALFSGRMIDKRYEAIARSDSSLRFPISRTSCVQSGDHFMQMREIWLGGDAQRDGAGPCGTTPNAHTDIDLIETRDPWARYVLRPATGKRHQLRVHMAALGLPILGDRIYPRLLPCNTDEPDNPLRLLAAGIAFRDPVSGQERCFSSSRRLDFPPP